MIANNDVGDPDSDRDDKFSSGRLNVATFFASLGQANPISRAQAKRLLQHAASNACLVLDFEGVAHIGQAFADEVFRVFANAHPNVELAVEHALPEVQQMIRRAEVARDQGAT